MSNRKRTRQSRSRKDDPGVELKGVVFREGNRYVSHIPQLGIATSGKTFEQVQERTVDMVRIYFEEAAQEKGRLDALLRDLGLSGKHLHLDSIPIQLSYADRQEVQINHHP